jgi:prepilin-type N-terminal cleavage/methylation domain-containing protein/prepilin-type processing-associated H-X9-DG protein
MEDLRERGVRRGFTLVELLVVIGIIAVLISILLPALSKVRRQANGTACLSNMRQLAQAVLMYANENRYWMPCIATSQQAGWVNGAPTAGGGTATNTSNWIAWAYVLDPYQGNQQSGFPATNDQNVTYSALAPYLNMPYTPSSYLGTGGLPLSNDVNAQYGKVFLCPGDDPLQRPKSMNNGAGVLQAVSAQKNYYYSYGMNSWINVPVKFYDGVAPNGDTKARVWGDFNGKITSIANSADIILMIDQDATQNSSAQVTMAADNWMTNAVNTVAARHYGNVNVSSALVGGTAVNQDGYGNASFCDGHAAEIGRKEALKGQHTGDPVADPVPGTPAATSSYGTW